MILWTIVKKDLLRDVLSARLALMLVLSCVLMPLSFGLSARQYQERNTEYQERSAANDTVPAPSVLSIVATGLDGERYGSGIGRYVAGGQTPDPLFVVRVVLSLIAVLAGAGALSEEWSGGLLRVMLAGPLSRSVMILARVVSGLLSVLYPYVLSCLLALPVMLLMGVSMTTSQWFGLFLILSSFSLYLALFYLLGLTVSMFAPSSGTSTLSALTIWAVLVLVIPQSVVSVVGHRLPAPSRQQVNYEIGRIRDAFAREPGGLAMGSPEELEQCRAVEVRRMNMIDNQSRTGALILSFLPSGAIVTLTTHIAGTGVDFSRTVLRPWALGEPLRATTWGYAAVFDEGLLVPTAVLILYGVLLLVLAYAGFVRRDVC